GAELLRVSSRHLLPGSMHPSCAGVARSLDPGDEHRDDVVLYRGPGSEKNVCQPLIWTSRLRTLLSPANKSAIIEEEAMARRIVDISVPLQSDIASDPPGHEPKIAYVDHKQSAPSVCAFFPGLTPADLPDGEGWAMERIDISTPHGTHLDAPYHFASTMDQGKRGLRIDEVPLE